MTRFTINDTDREDFVRNDEDLYRWWKHEMRGEKKIRQFVRTHRAEIDYAIQKASRPRDREPSYYMRGRGAYGPGTSPAPTRS